jgi:hypothetical protein
MAAALALGRALRHSNVPLARGNDDENGHNSVARDIALGRRVPAFGPLATNLNSSTAVLDSDGFRISPRSSMTRRSARGIIDPTRKKLDATLFSTAARF